MTDSPDVIGTHPREERRKPWLEWLKVVLAAGPLILCLWAFLIRSDALYAITIWPSFVPGFLGLIVSALLVRKLSWRVRGPVLLGWLTLTLAFSEWRALINFGSWPSAQWQTARQQGQALRIVTLNCAGGDPEAAMELEALKPDVVLLQESPGEKSLLELSRKLFGGSAKCFRGPDTSILVSGTAEASKQLLAANTTGIVWSRPQGQPVLIVSARFTPPVFRLDYWNPACWSDYAENRRIRRLEVAEVAERMRTMTSEQPVIFGGDLNSPPDDGIFGRIAGLGLRDSFAIAGMSWGGTAVNDYPLARIDQIWLSEHFEPAAVYAVKTVHSDHRMVVCDVFLKE
jgi:vancomycin resistance protein VanJ